MHFKNLVNNLASISERPQEPIRVMDIIHNPYFNPKALEEKIMDISNMNDQELFDFVKKNYRNILELVFNNDNLIRYFIDVRFLQAITTITSNINLDYILKMNACKLVYDYLSLPKDQRDPMVYTAIQNFGKAVAKDTLPYLIGIGVPEYYALYMTCAMNSSSNPHINIKRMHYIIATSEPDTFNEQKIINVYIHMSRYHGLRMSNLLTAFMIDDSTCEDNPYIYEMYSIISLAVLDMLNSFSSNDIKLVLTAYSNDIKMKYNGDLSLIRFSLRDGISSDYKRIKYYANSLTEKGYFVP